MLPEYNGWTNKPTWSIYTWLSNDYNQYHRVLDLLKQDYGHAVERDDALKDYVENQVYGDLPDHGTITHDLALYALAWVDWAELVNAFLDA